MLSATSTLDNTVTNDIILVELLIQTPLGKNHNLFAAAKNQHYVFSPASTHSPKACSSDEMTTSKLAHRSECEYELLSVFVCVPCERLAATKPI